MTKEKLVPIQEAELTNNCPECFNQDITLTFYQKHKYGKLYHNTTSEVTHELRCNKCNSIIYPVKWTEDIERSFDYYRKTVKPGRASIRFTTLFFVLVLLLICLVGAAIYVFLLGGISEG
jgi:hypothetical protein